MRSKLVTQQDVETAAPATHGPSPADFPVGSVESRAAARAMAMTLDSKNAPQEGDVFIDLDATPEDVSLFRAFVAGYAPRESSKRIPGVPVFWFKFPDGFNPDSLVGEGGPAPFAEGFSDKLYAPTPKGVLR